MPQLSDDRTRTKVYQYPEPMLDTSSWLSFHGELHPDTSPEVIFAGHCDAVSAAVEMLRSAATLASPSPITVEAISELTMLPAWNVKRALERLCLLDLVATSAGTAGTTTDDIHPDLPDREVLTRLKKAINDATLSTVAIAKAANLPVAYVRTFMKDRPAAFEMVKVPRKPLAWRLVETFGGMFSGPSTGGSATSRNRTRERRSDSKVVVSKKAVAA